MVTTRLMAASVALCLGLGLAAPTEGLAAGPGTTGADFLRLPVGPRQIGLGEQGVALADDVYSLDYNPASIAVLPYQEAAFMHNAWAEGMGQEYLAYAHPKTPLGGVGASINLLRSGELKGFDNSGQAAGDVSAEDLAVSLAYARRVWGEESSDFGRGLAAGFAAKHIRERLENDSASGFAADAGLLAHWPLRRALMRAGLAMGNLGSGPSYYGRRAPLPRTLAFGLSATARSGWGDPMTAALEVKQTLGAPLSVSAGAEYWVNALFALRLGYRFSDDLGPGIRAGLGFKIKIVQFDYAMSLMGAFGISHRAGFTVKLGAPVDRTPEPSPAVKEAAVAVKRAKGLLRQGRTLEALLEINRALELDPNSAEALQILDQVRGALKQPETEIAAPALREARRLFDEKRTLEALLEINRALELDPNSPEALRLLEQVQQRLKEAEGAPKP